MAVMRQLFVALTPLITFAVAPLDAVALAVQEMNVCEPEGTLNLLQTKATLKKANEHDPNLMQVQNESEEEDDAEWLPIVPVAHTNTSAPALEAQVLDTNTSAPHTNTSAPALEAQVLDTNTSAPHTNTSAPALEAQVLDPKVQGLMADAGFPDLSGIPGVKEIKDAAHGVASAAVATALKAIATTVKKLLSKIDTEVSGIDQEGNKVVAKLKTDMNATDANVKARLKAFDSLLHDSIRTFLYKWASLSDMVQNTGKTIMAALNVAGKQDLATMLEQGLNITLTTVNSFVQDLKYAETIVQDIGKVAEKEAAGKLWTLNETLTTSNKDIAAFPSFFEEAFKKLTAGIVASLPKEVPADVRKGVEDAFASVQAAATALAEHVVQSAIKFTSGLKESADLIPLEPQKSGSRRACGYGFSFLLLAIAMIVGL
eukprot:gnl/TRDRNA2_/TRDRNA2_37581_c0_seq1.p1 gnl/TRDRNA2_/TRDRNA2_37581_c0~~gnl/TRDRNA2_/TRDRNA2_37581_c0_seq1.p1  ORF type:complete len:429 (+),score=117.36 gnl/TRDRNA2_/TRDRNA2_37581_c0_seq1:37-1323(+)